MAKPFRGFWERWLLSWSLGWGSRYFLSLGFGIPHSLREGLLLLGICGVFALGPGWKRGSLLIPAFPVVLFRWGLLLPVDLPGCGAAYLVCRALCRGKGLGFALGIPLVSMGLCLAKGKDLPHPGGVLAVLTAVGVLVLTDQTRLQQPRQSRRLGLRALALLAPVLAGLLFLNPQESYVNQSAAVRDLLGSVFPLTGDSRVLSSALASAAPAPREVILGDSPRVPSRQIVMTVTTQESGSLYLRQRSYDHYDGRSWSAGDLVEEFGTSSQAEELVILRTRQPLPQLLVAYYPGESMTLTGGAVPNPAGLSQYTVTRSAAASQRRGSITDLTPWLELPEITRPGARTVLEQILGEGDPVQAIVSYLHRGTYSLTTGIRAAEGEDFVLTFLNSGMEGSCTHFASAAAVLLRAAGIPARLVGGYLVETIAGEETPVTQENAHAWVEYWDPEPGIWKILEATPPGTTPAPSSQAPALRQENLPTSSSGSPLLRLFLLLALLECQFALRAGLGRLRLKLASSITRGRLLWKRTVLLCELLGEAPPRPLYFLAQKAVFSPHGLTEGELTAFREHREGCRKRMRKIFFPQRLVYRWVYGVY